MVRVNTLGSAQFGGKIADNILKCTFLKIIIELKCRFQVRLSRVHYLSDIIRPNHASCIYTFTFSFSEDRPLPEVVRVRLADGRIMPLVRRLREHVMVQPQPDSVKDYAHLTLELGMVFSYYETLTKTPSREKLLAATKMLLPIMKGNNPQAKYPLELLRFLVQQYSLLSQKQAAQALQACFVNTRGRANTHVPADQQMEWLVKQNKKHIKHLFSNKDAGTIKKKSAALAGLGEVAENFDSTSGTMIRTKKHSAKSAREDELILIRALNALQPFRHTPGRRHAHHIRTKPSLLDSFDGYKFRQWFNKWKMLFTK